MPYGIGKAGWLTFEEAESALDIVSEGSSGWMSAHCPAHDDNRPSLGVKEDEDGYLVVHCRAGCDARDVIAAIRELLEDG